MTHLKNWILTSAAAPVKDGATYLASLFYQTEICMFNSEPLCWNIREYRILTRTLSSPTFTQRKLIVEKVAEDNQQYWRRKKRGAIQQTESSHRKKRRKESISTDHSQSNLSEIGEMQDLWDLIRIKNKSIESQAGTSPIPKRCRDKTHKK